MSVAVSRSDPSDTSALGALRASGGVRLAFACENETTRLTDLEERGGFRAKFPSGEIGAEAVLINTGGGMLGGDCYRFDVLLKAVAIATVTSQSAERVYRAMDAAPTQSSVTLRVDAGAVLSWLPQETLLFNGARLSRHIEADVHDRGTLLLAEAVVFGRAAMGEDIHAGSLRDRWSIRRGGKLIFAEALSFTDDMHAQLQSAAIADGARAMATLLFVAPDAEERRDAARSALGVPRGRTALSAWNGLLTARFLAADSVSLRHDLVRVASVLTRAPMPRVWNC